MCTSLIRPGGHVANVGVRGKSVFGGLITDDGDVTHKSTADFLLKYMNEFHLFIARVYTVLPRDV